jgi:hypothetical protein
MHGSKNYSLLCFLLLWACISDDAAPALGRKSDAGIGEADAMPMPDAAGCAVRDSVQSCGADCKTCPSSDRGTAACDGMSCGFVCNGGLPQCSDKSCSRMRFDFTSMTNEGVQSASPGVTQSIQSKEGNPALAFAVSVFPPKGVQFTVPVCVTGTTDLSQKTLSMRIFLEGGTAPDASAMPPYFIVGSLANFQSNSNLEMKELTTGVWVPYSAKLSTNAFSGSASTLSLQIGTLYDAFTGTVWVDDIEFK